MSSRLGGWAAAMLLLAACAQPASGSDNGDGGNSGGSTETPAGDTGEVREMHGIWSIGFEQSDFAECPPESDCPAPSGYDGCWLDFTDEAAAQLDPALRDRRDNWRYRMTIRGIREEGGDGYGHLGASDCQVTVTEILSMERIR